MTLLASCDAAAAPDLSGLFEDLLLSSALDRYRDLMATIGAARRGKALRSTQIEVHE